MKLSSSPRKTYLYSITDMAQRPRQLMSVTLLENMGAPPEIRAECSFDLDSMDYEDDNLEAGLAHWLISVFSLPNIFNLGLPRSKNGLLKLHNIPALIFREEDRPEDKCEANRLARIRIEELLSEHESGKDDPELVKSIMKRIELVDREEPVEYPVSRPRPFGLLSTESSTGTDF